MTNKYETQLKILRQGCRKKIYAGSFDGEEPYYIDRISGYIEKNVLTEEEKSFNQTIFYGKDSDARTISDTAYRYPMMADKQVVIVKEAQSLKTIDGLSEYASRPMSSTLLVINYKYKTLDKRTRLYKAIKTNGVVLDAKKLYEKIGFKTILSTTNLYIK